MLPEPFVYLNDPRIILEMSYTTHQNFLGRPVKGYLAPKCILTKAAEKALISVQNQLDSLNKNYCLKIFDAYRPQQAVNDFKHWAGDFHDLKMKEHYYPELSKPALFDLGYIMEHSSHSRGSTVDLTITVGNPKDPQNTVDLDMGTIFDFFGEASHTANPGISEIAKHNRKLLKTLMEEQGFLNYPLEWWHYTLKDEPFKDQYFDFEIK